MTSPSESKSVLLPAFARLGVPVFVFGAVFCASMTLMRVLLTPDRFPVRTGESVVRLKDLAEERQSLKDKHARLLQERTDLETKTPTPVLQQIGTIVRVRPEIGAALGQIETSRRSFAIAGADPVTITVLSVRGAESAVTLTGEVRDRGDRSIQILAAFVDALRKSGRFAGVSEPEYIQSNPEGGGSLSPFQIFLTIPHGA